MELEVDGRGCRQSAAGEAGPGEGEADEGETEEGHLGEVRVEGAAQTGVEAVHHAVRALEPAPGHTREVHLAGGGWESWVERIIPRWDGMGWDGMGVKQRVNRVSVGPRCLVGFWVGRLRDWLVGWLGCVSQDR